MNGTVILYGKDEYRLYEAALAIEQVIAVKLLTGMRIWGIVTADGKYA